ncbi:SDR family NAD(P)-dependent oxidoreductase, partial [Clavibacter michiganensis]
MRKDGWRNELVVITGGASGIGYRTAVLFAAKGASVVIIDIQ